MRQPNPNESNPGTGARDAVLLIEGRRSGKNGKGDGEPNVNSGPWLDQGVRGGVAGADSWNDEELEAERRRGGLCPDLRRLRGFLGVLLAGGSARKGVFGVTGKQEEAADPGSSQRENSRIMGGYIRGPWCPSTVVSETVSNGPSFTVNGLARKTEVELPNSQESGSGSPSSMPLVSILVI